MENLKRKEKCGLTEKVMQFGEGNFLRGFADWMIDRLNKEADWNGGVVVVQPLPGGMCEKLSEQDGLYHLHLRGLQDGEKTEELRKVECISRCINPYENLEEFFECAKNPDLRFIISNTTEAGIEYKPGDDGSDFANSTYPGRLTMFLKKRFDAGLGGFILLPCELIDNNGKELKKCVLKYAEDFGYGSAFTDWVNSECHFTSTLVDRIVTGYPASEIEEYHKKLGVIDNMVDTAEIFHLWVIEGDKSLAEEIPFHKYGMNVLWTDDVTPYKKRKVRILNGAHTMMVTPAMLAGVETVGEAMEDGQIFEYIRKGLFEEIIPTLELPKDELISFAEAVLDRFRNPFIRHYLKSIALNSVSKYKVRVLPSLLEYRRVNGDLPVCLVASMAALIYYYKTGEPNDDAQVIEKIRNSSCEEILDDKSLWDEDLSFMTEETEKLMNGIEKDGMRKVLSWIL